MVRTRSEMYKIPYKEILYISSSNHSIEIITEKEKFRQMISLREVLSHLPAYFQQCHRTIIINMKKVTCLTDNWVVLNGKEELPVGKKYLEKIRSTFLSQ
jgi:two-component system, LytTR family, response regulator LytT